MHAGIHYGLSIASFLAVVACDAQTQGQRSTISDQTRPAASDPRPATKAAPPKPMSTDAEVRTGGPKDDKDKEPRGNTPPGTDRSGAGPASGAIVDPTGAAAK